MRQRIQLDPARDWFDDRRIEVCEYFDLDAAGLADLAGNLDVDSNEYRDRKMCASFAGASGMSDDEIMAAYREAAPHYMLRLMVAYDRAAQALPLLNLMLQRAPGGRILDYGCGASDTGLVFAVHGFKVSICDVAGGNLEFARRRYERRGIDVDVIPATETDVYPDLGRDLDFVAALEILEHLPSPIQALRRMNAALKPGGLFVVREASFEEKQDGDHLASAYEEWRSGDYAAVRDDLFLDVTRRYGRRHKGGKYMKVYAKR